MKKSIYVLAAILGVVASAGANDFAEDIDHWAVGGVPAVKSLVNENGDNCLKITYQVTSPNFLTAGYYGLDSDGVNWSMYDSFSFKYKITDRGAGNHSFSIYDCWGQKVADAVFSNGNVTNGWVNVNLNLDAIITVGQNLENVSFFVFSASQVFYDPPTGDLWLNDVMVPEPAAMLLFSLGGLLMRKYKK